MKNKWWTLFYYAFFHFSWSFVQGTPEKLTQEQVLEELGVKIETKEWTFSVTGIEGNLVKLPCNISTSKSEDDVKLVLWFKNGSNRPIYTYDNRDGSHSHWSDDTVLRGRASFEIAATEKAMLTIDNVQYEDHSVYKCRVDFKIAPTSISSITLKVIVPPATPTIFLGRKRHNSAMVADEEDIRKHEMSLGIQDNSAAVTEIGPYTLGDSLRLRCVSKHGRPLANVTWWRDNSVLIDDSFETFSEGAEEENVINDLVIAKLDRYHNGVTLTCRAFNDIQVPPADASVKIRMRYGPSVVKLMLKRRHLSAGKSHQIKCEAIGAKPQATISWWVGGKEINNFVSSALIGENNATLSTLTYSPKPEDHGKLLSCQAFVEGLPGSELEDSRRLHIQYAPHAELRLGRSLNASNIKEGDDVYFECLIHSNPAPSTIVWTRHGKPLKYSLEEGVIITNQSLVLQKVRRQESGLYQCQAINSEGTGSSNTVQLPIKYKPYCRPDQEDVYGVATGETVKIPCDVIGDPSGDNMRFEWIFNTTTEWYPKEPDTAYGVTSRERGWTRAYIRHTPKSEMDFGSIMCWATNNIGRQSEPCIFHLLPAGKPEPVTNCTLVSSSYSTMRISCQPGFNGGLKQSFTLEVQETDSNRKKGLVANMTGRIKPDFILTGLIPDTGYMISVYAVNKKGNSDRMVLQAYTQKSDQLIETYESALTNMDGFQITPLFGILMTLGCAAAVLFLSISAYFCIRRRPNNHHGSTTANTNSTSNYRTAAPSVGYNSSNCNVVIRETNALPKKKENPDIVPTQQPKIAAVAKDGTDGGFEVQGDKTKFTTLQRQRKQLYEDIQDSKMRSQSLRRNLLSPTQFEGSSEKLLMGSASEMDHYMADPRYFATTPSPCSTPTPPPYNRNRLASPVSSQWSPRSGTNPLMTRIHRDPSAGKPAKFITYSCPPEAASSSVVSQGFIAEENLEEAASVASSRESRV